MNEKQEEWKRAYPLFPRAEVPADLTDRVMQRIAEESAREETAGEEGGGFLADLLSLVRFAAPAAVGVALLVMVLRFWGPASPSSSDPTPRTSMESILLTDSDNEPDHLGDLLLEDSPES